MPKPICWTVAVDESDAAWNMLEWVEHNVDDRDTVRLLTVREPLGETEERSAARLTIAQHRLTDQHASLRVERGVVDGPTVVRLLADTTESDVLVIGGRRSERVWANVTGRVAERVVARAGLPVIVVPERWSAHRDGQSVVLGVDGRTASTALAFAADRAERSCGDLVLVRAWEPPTSISPFGQVYLQHDVPLWEHEGQLELDAAIRAVSHAHPDLRMRAELRQGRPADVLQRTQQIASLLVTGRRHRSALGALLDGSVGETLMHHGVVPVCIVPDAVT